MGKKQFSELKFWGADYKLTVLLKGIYEKVDSAIGMSGGNPIDYYTKYLKYKTKYIDYKDNQ